MNTQDFWSYLIKHNGHNKQNTRKTVASLGDVNNERRIKTIVIKLNGWILIKLQLSLYKPFSSSFKKVYVFAEKAAFRKLALQMSDKNCSCLKSPLGIWTNPVYKTCWASLTAKQAITVGSSLGLMWSCYNRVGQGFWVYGIQGLFKSGIQYIAA